MHLESSAGTASVVGASKAHHRGDTKSMSRRSKKTLATDIQQGRNWREFRQQLTIDVLRLLNEESDSTRLVGGLLVLFKDATGADAVGLRIKDGEGFPYYEQAGFSQAFVEAENSLCARSGDGSILRDDQGRPELAGACGVVLQGRTDPEIPCFTAKGSFWSNRTSDLLQFAPQDDLGTGACNFCIREGYQSVALIPLRSGDQITGLLQLNACAEGHFTLDQIELYEGLAAGIGVALKQRQAEEALRLSKDRLSSVFAAIHDLVCIADAQATALWANAAWKQVFGPVTQDRPSPLELIHPDDKERVAEAWQALVAEGSEIRDLEYSFQDPYGKYMTFLSSAQVLPDPGEQRFLVVAHDITGRKRTERVISQSESRYRSLFEDSPLALWEEDLAALKAYVDGLRQAGIEDLEGYFECHPAELTRYVGLVKVLDVNRAALELCQARSKQELLAGLEGIFCEESYAAFVEQVQRIGAGETAVQVESVTRTLQGVKKDVLLSWSVVAGHEENWSRVIVSEFDISARRRARAQVAASAKFPSENPSPVLRVAADGTIQYANSASGLLLGEWGVAVHQCVPADWRAVITECANTGRVRMRGTRIGSKVYSFTVAPVVGEGYVNLYGHDVSEQRQAEVELTASHEKLRQLSQHLEAVREEELARVAREIHDELGQGLTAIKMDLVWIKKNLSAKNEALGERLESACGLVDATIRSVKRVSADLRPGLLDDLGLGAAIEWLATEFQKHTGIACEATAIEEDVQLSEEGRTALFRVCQEALTNVSRHAQATRVIVRLSRKRQSLTLEVRDNGRGIADQELSDPGAFGILGMRERVRALGGEATISGEANTGTKVVVRIPLDRQENRNEKNPHS